MKKIFIIIISLSFSLNMYSQVKYTVTDSAFLRGRKFLLIETEDGVAEIKAFYKGGGEAPISGVIKMAPPVYFVKGYCTNRLLQDDFMIDYKGGDIATVFLISGNRASKCHIESRVSKVKDGFYGMSVQGIIIISTEGIGLTDFLDYGFICAERNSLGMKDLYYFVEKHINIKKKAEAEKKKKAKEK